MGQNMYTTAILDVLRDVNRLEGERRGLKEGSAAALQIEKQVAVARTKLPHSLLFLHDRFAACGKPSIVRLAGANCSACHLKLPSGELGALRVAGRYGVCPNCSAFVWSGPAAVSEPVTVHPAKSNPERSVRA